MLGLGNPILTDDGVGIHVVRDLTRPSPHQVLPAAVDVAEASVGGLRLLERIAGYERVILVDAIQTQNGRPGDVYRLHAGDLCASLHSGCTHDLTLPGALALGRGVGMQLPKDDDILIIAVEAEDVLTFGEQCTPQVQAALPRAAQMVVDEIT